MEGVTTASYVSVFGTRASASNAKSNATAIGANSFANCSNCVVLGSVAGTNGAGSNVSVGIGTTTPVFPLNFGNQIGDKISLYNGSGSHYGFGIQNGLMQIHTDISGSDIAFGYGSSGSFTETMRMKGNKNLILGNGDVNGGNLGIGIINPVHAIHIQANSGFGAGGRAHMLLHETENDFTRLRMSNSAGAAFWEMAAKPNDDPLHSALNFYASNGGDIISMRADGNVTIAGSLTQNSDIRYKRNIRSIDNATMIISQLNGYNYYWNEENRDPSMQAGVLAQEVKKVLPGLVKENEKGLLSVNYLGLIPYLIQSIKEQQEQIEQLQEQSERLDKLEKELENLKKLLQAKTIQP
jgi:hypothetical protein